jgi:O-antigen/teichoic acid export membrane protein
LTPTRRTLVNAGALSLVGYGVTFVLQFALPRVLLGHWGDGGYALYIAITGYAAYIGVADAGVQNFLSQRLVTLHGSNDGEYAALARGGLRALSGLAVFGALTIAFWSMVLGKMVAKEVVQHSHVLATTVFLALAVQLFGGGVGLALSGWSTSIEQSTGRYARTQLFALMRSSASLGVIVIAARLGFDVVHAIVFGVSTTVVIDGIRFQLARRHVPSNPGALSVKKVLMAARGGLLLMVASGTQNSLLPAIAASVAPMAVGAAIPGRTVSNSARVLATSAQSVVWVPLAARLTAEVDDGRAFMFWRRNSLLLSFVQLLGLPAITLVAPFLVPRWLPMKSHAIMQLLPVYCVEQAIFAASVPANMVLLAVGRFGRAGLGFLAASLISLTLCVVTMPRLGPMGYAGSTLAGTLFGFVPVLTVLEWHYWTGRGQRPLRVIGPRIALCVAAAVSGPMMYWSALGATAYLLVLLAIVGAIVRRDRAMTFREPE